MTIESIHEKLYNLLREAEELLISENIKTKTLFEWKQNLHIQKNVSPIQKVIEGIKKALGKD